MFSLGTFPLCLFLIPSLKISEMTAYFMACHLTSLPCAAAKNADQGQEVIIYSKSRLTSSHYADVLCYLGLFQSIQLRNQQDFYVPKIVVHKGEKRKKLMYKCQKKCTPAIVCGKQEPSQIMPMCVVTISSKGTWFLWLCLCNISLYQCISLYLCTNISLYFYN